MPDYEITDPRSGKTLVLSGNAPPTEAELEQVFAQFAAPAERTWGDTAKDVGTGLVKSGVGAFVGLGEMWHKVPGVSATVDTLYGTPGISQQSFQEARQTVTPTNAAQSAGKLAGDIGQVLIPGNTITRTGMALAARAPRGLQLASRVGVEGLAGGGISAVQGGDPTTGAALSGAIPVVGKAAGAVSSRLKAAVPEHVMKALGPTKEKFKAMAERITPGIVSRRLGGSREALQTQAHEAAQQAGQLIDEALRTEHGGRVLNVQSVQDALEQAKNRYRNVIMHTVHEATETAAPAVSDVVESTPRQLPSSFRAHGATPDELFQDVLTDAKRQGFKGSPAELRGLFDDAVKDAKDFAVDMAGLEEPTALLKAIARNGGIGKDTSRLGRVRLGHAGIGMPGEIDKLWESSTGLVVGKGYKKGTSILKSSRKLSGGAIGGVSGVLKHNGKNLEEMVEALRADGFGERIPDIGALLDEIEAARVALMRTKEQGLGDALQAVGLRPGTRWWHAADEGFDVAAIESGEAATAPAVTAPLTRTVRQTIELDKRPIRQIQKLQEVLKEHGDEMTVDQLVAVRRVWDDVVAQVGGYAHRAPGGIGMPLKDATEVWAKRKATTAIRQLLDKEVPELSALNKEFAFWKSLDDVLTQTMKRTAPQGPGLRAVAAEGAGRLAGALNPVGGVMGTVSKVWVLGKIVKLAEQAFASPRWQFASARMKDDLADAIVNGKLDKAVSTLARITAVQGSKVPAAVGAN